VGRWWGRGGRATPQGVKGTAFVRDPRYLVTPAALRPSIGALLVSCGLVLSGLVLPGCSKEETSKPGDDRLPPVPTTPENRKPMSAAEVKRFEGLTAQQIADHKQDLLKKCYEPAKDEAVTADGGIDPEALKRAASGNRSSVTVMVVYDEEGKELTREVHADLADKNDAVASCVDDNLPKLRVPAPRRKLRIKVPLEFP